MVGSSGPAVALAGVIPLRSVMTSIPVVDLRAFTQGVAPDLIRRAFDVAAVLEERLRAITA